MVQFSLLWCVLSLPGTLVSCTVVLLYYWTMLHCTEYIPVPLFLALAVATHTCLSHHHLALLGARLLPHNYEMLGKFAIAQDLPGSRACTIIGRTLTQNLPVKSPESGECHPGTRGHMEEALQAAASQIYSSINQTKYLFYAKNRIPFHELFAWKLYWHTDRQTQDTACRSVPVTASNPAPYHCISPQRLSASLCSSLELSTSSNRYELECVSGL